MLDFTLNDNPILTKFSIGEENSPLLIIDDFAHKPADFISHVGDGSSFKADGKNFYPGKRSPAPQVYSEEICKKYLPLFKSYFGLDKAISAKPVMSAFAITDRAPEHLKPIQMLPHFDTTNLNQLAVVHYLCEPEHGGISFYRHRASSFETITQKRLAGYGHQLKKEAIAHQLHKNPCYMGGNNALFEKLHTVEARMNRAVIYPSRMLHSGDINPLLGLSSDPKIGRLTIGSFILVECS
jgi:hypothetical protein